MTKVASPARWSGRERGAGREKRSGARKKKKKKVDLPVAQLLAAHSRCYLLRLESPVSQGRSAEEAKYVTGGRQVSDRAGGVGISTLEGKFGLGSVLSSPFSPPSQIYTAVHHPPTPLISRNTLIK